MKKAINVDLWAGLFTLLVTGVFWMQIADRDEFSVHSLYYPDKILPILAIMGVAILIKAFVRPTMKEHFCKELNREMALTAIISCGWVLLMGFLGFLISSTLAMLTMLYGFQTPELHTPRGLLKILAIIGGELAFMWIVFVEFLSVTLPTGSVFRLLNLD